MNVKNLTEYENYNCKWCGNKATKKVQSYLNNIILCDKCFNNTYSDKCDYVLNKK